MFVILVLLWIILFNKKDNSPDDFEKKTYCRSLYNEVYDSLDEQINRHDNTISIFMSNFDFFYSKKTDSCVVSYVRMVTYYDSDQRVNSDTYIIKDYLSENNIFYCVQSDDNFDEYLNKNCYENWNKKLEELKGN